MSELKERQINGQFIDAFNLVACQAYQNAKDKGFRDKEVHVGTRLALIHGEVSEALEAARVGDSNGFAEELADVVIRLMDLSVGEGINLGIEIIRKMNKNAERPRMHGGKLF